MGRGRLAPREQKLVLLAAVLIAMWVVVSRIGRPLLDQLTQLEQRTSASQQKLDRLRELADRHPSIERAYQAYAVYRSEESDESGQGAFFSELEELAQSVGLQLSLKPRPIQRDGSLSRLKVELDVEATQEKLLAFLDRLFAHPSLIELDRLRISASASKAYPLKATLLVNKVVIR
jgi:hypothetical protein